MVLPGRRRSVGAGASPSHRSGSHALSCAGDNRLEPVDSREHRTLAKDIEPACSTPTTGIAVRGYRHLSKGRYAARLAGGTPRYCPRIIGRSRQPRPGSLGGHGCRAVGERLRTVMPDAHAPKPAERQWTPVGDPPNAGRPRGDVRSGRRTSLRPELHLCRAQRTEGPSAREGFAGPWRSGVARTGSIVSS